MLININPPDWKSECDILHDYLQSVLNEVSRLKRFSRERFEKKDDKNIDFLGTNKNSVIAKALTSACKVDQQEKEAFTKAHLDDHDFYHSPPGFLFSVHNGAGYLSLGSLLVKSYENIFGKERGFRKLSKDTLNRRWIIKKFIEANSELICCPYCGGEMIFETAQIDHYFPKGKYPTLSLSFWNMVPICYDCNSTYKLQSDPLNGESSVMAINGVCLPYKGSLDRYLELEFNDLGIEDEVIVKAKVHVSVQIKKQVDNFLALTKLNKHWNRQLRNAKIQLLDKVREGIREGQIKNIVDTRAYIINISKSLEGKESVIGFSLLILKYYEWIATQDVRLDTLLKACE